MIEIELRTPKCPDIGNKQKITKDTQIDEETLDQEMSYFNQNQSNKKSKDGLKGKTKVKGKGKAKGKGKKKKKEK